MSDPTTVDHGGNDAHGVPKRASPDSTVSDNLPTPRSEMPIPLKVSAPSTSVKETNGNHGVSGIEGYFTAHPARTQLKPAAAVSPVPSPPAPRVGTSDVTATGQIHGPNSGPPLQPLQRPQPHSAVSSSSTRSADSARTVVASAIEPALPNLTRQASSPSDQSHAPSRPSPLLKQRTSHPGQILTFTSALASQHLSGSRTVGSSPAITPGSEHVSAGATPPHTSARDLSAPSGSYASPFHHFTVPPKETHVADVDVDPISGRKLINTYEIIDELGRGTHGKVKLGRDLSQENTFVAIKIVERFSKRRKLGKLGTTEDKVKKEIAILKQARHENVVALLEVIDDPTRKKVYIVLEWVERGEIVWRERAPHHAIAVVEARRHDRVRRGNKNARTDAEDAAVVAEATRRVNAYRQVLQHMAQRQKREASDSAAASSNTTRGDDRSETSEDDRSSHVSSGSQVNRRLFSHAPRASRASSPLPPHYEESPIADASKYQPFTGEPQTLSPTTSSTDFGDDQFSSLLEGTMYGAYAPSSGEQSRAPSRHSAHPSGSDSNVSSDSLAQWASEILDQEINPELEHVPIMTMEDIHNAFQDTLLGLQYLHYQGIIHRDIKPPNLLVTFDYRVKISDFGVSYLGRPIHEGGPREEVSEHEALDLDDEAKELAKTVGTPAFYAPELCITEAMENPPPITKAIDVWALGITMFCMLFGRTPFVDSEYVVMRQIADEEVCIPRKRLRPVKKDSVSPPPSRNRAGFSTSPALYRDPLEFAYDDISDELYDLLRGMLRKDPRLRMSLEDVRHHPWMINRFENKMDWLAETDPSRQSKGKIHVSKEDVNAAVVPLQFLDRVRSGIKKVSERLGLSSKSSGRSRTQSVASTGAESAPAASIASSGTNIGREEQNGMRSDETIYAALKASKDSEHPLARSVEASPELSEADESLIPTSHAAELISTKLTPDRSSPARSNLPERTSTVMATSGSMRTVRPSDFQNSPTDESPPPSPGLPGTPTALGSPGSLSGGWGSGMARRMLKSVRERSTARSREGRGTSSERVSISSLDTRGEPSLAISHTTATGHVNNSYTDEIGFPPSPSSRDHSPTGSRPPSTVSSASGHLTGPMSSTLRNLSRSSSRASNSSHGRRAVMQENQRNMSPRGMQSFVPPESSEEQWDRAKSEQFRKLMNENKAEPSQSRPFDDRTCPPSPDDQRQKQTDSRRMSELDISQPVSPQEPMRTIDRQQLNPTMKSSTSDFGSNGSISMSLSNPSVPSAISEASSIDPADRLGPSEASEKSDLMSSSETAAPALEYRQEIIDEGYNADNAESMLGSDDDEYESSSDSDGGLVMTRRKSAAKPPREDTTKQERRSTDLSVRSVKASRSGSNNTMKKIDADGSDENQ